MHGATFKMLDIARTADVWRSFRLVFRVQACFLPRRNLNVLAATSFFMFHFGYEALEELCVTWNTKKAWPGYSPQLRWLS